MWHKISQVLHIRGWVGSNRGGVKGVEVHHWLWLYCVAILGNQKHPRCKKAQDQSEAAV